MNVDEAWESFIKSHQIKKSSIDEKLDIIASQMNELQTDVSRLAENIPEMQGDAAAMEAANATAGPEMGTSPGLDQLGAMLGGEEDAPMEEDAPVEEGAEGEEAPMDEGAPMEDIAPEEDIPVEGTPEESVPLDTGASNVDDISEEELDALLSEEDVGVPEADNFNTEMIMKIKDLIMNEEDARKLSILSELLTLVANSDNTSSMENMEGDIDPMDDVAPIADGDIGTEPLDKSDTFKKADDVVNTPSEAVDANEDATDKNLDDGPEPLTTASSPTESVAKAHDTSELMAKIMEAIMPIIKELTDEFTGNDEDTGDGGPGIVMSAEVDELPLDEESADAPIDKEPVADDASSEKESDDEEEDDTEDKSEGDDEESESEDDGDDDSEDDDPEDDISEDTEHFEESETVTKSFKNLFAERMATRVGVDGVFAKTPNYGGQIAHMKDGFRPASYEPIYGSADEDAGGRHIMTYDEVASILKSDRPGSSVSVNGELERPDPLTFKKSSAPSVSFRELMNSSNPHDLMKKDWDEYNIFKSQY